MKKADMGREKQEHSPNTVPSQPRNGGSLRSDDKGCGLRAVGACPFGDFCGTARSEKYAFYPQFQKVMKNDYVWSSRSTGGYVTVIEEGLLAPVILISPDADEVVFGLLGKSTVVGLMELQDEVKDIDALYSLKAIVDSRICRIPRATVQRLMSQHHSLYTRVTAVEMTNMTSAFAGQTIILSKTRVYDKIDMLFHVLNDLIRRDEKLNFQLQLTHKDIAFLISSDRVSVTRALGKMQEQHIVNLGYHQISRALSPEEDVTRIVRYYRDGNEDSLK